MKTNQVHTTNSKERFDLRLNAAEKQKIQSAAELRGQRVAVFVREVMLREASAAIAAHKEATLSAEESKRFMDALSAPFQPNAKLARALARANR